MVEIDTLSQTKTAKKKNPFGAAHTYTAYIRDYPPPSPQGAKNALQIMSLAAYPSETNKGIFAWPKLKRTFSCRNKLVYSILFLFKFRTCCTRCWRPLGFKRVNHKVYTTWEYRAIMKVTGKNAVSRNQTML